MEALFLIGRIIFGGYFIYSGFNHFKNSTALAGYAKSKNVPYPKLAVLISGLFLLVGGLGVLFWLYPVWALSLIAIFLLIVSFSMHNFWEDKDDATRSANTINFSKNMALLGAALMLMAL